jgi:lysophospholipase
VNTALDLPPGGLAWDETLALTAADGVRLRGALWNGRGSRAGRGLVVLLQGRTEFLERCALPAAGLVERGFAVASLDWRGQGLSDRLVAEPLKGHVGRFTDYHLDLAALMAHPTVMAQPGPSLVLGNSMGGAIALGAVLRGQLAPRALLLSAPMLGIELTPFMRLASRVTLGIARFARGMERWPPFAPPGLPVEQPYVFAGFEENLLTGDRAVFDWSVAALMREPAFQLAMPTLGWLDQAFAEIAWLTRQGPPGCPGLCLLGTSEAIVAPAAVRAGADRLGLELVEIEGGRHEVLIEAEPMRSHAWAAIDRFLAAQGL